MRISLIYVFATSKYSYCKLIKQSNQSIHTFFSHFYTHLFYIEGNGKEGKVHEDLILSKMAETFVVHIVFHLFEHSFRFYASLSSVFSPSLEHSSSLAFCLYLLSLWFCSIVLFPFALRYRHLSGQSSHLTALYLAFSLIYPNAVFTCPVPILCIFCPIGQIQKSCSSL